MKRISLEELLAESGEQTYPGQCRYIFGQIEKKKIRPVKSSPLNGKTPALHVSFWRIEEAPDYGPQIDELKFEMVPAIRTDYYLKHPDVYRAEARWVKLLNHYFLEQDGKEPAPVSLNERSFQIWGREKFLQKEEGRRILAHCGVTMGQLFIYGTTEPLACYSAGKEVPQTVLILENKDTFFSMRRYLLGGADRIFGEKIGTVIYGAGKGILRSFADFRFCVEPHVNASENRILYFGDLDYEGIGIYERLERMFSAEQEPPGCKIRPFTAAYEKMVQKAEERGLDFLPEMKEKQNRNLSGTFFAYFSEALCGRMNDILKAGNYIPQEMINITDFDTPCAGE